MTLYPSKLLSTSLLSLAFLFSSSAFAATAVITAPEQAHSGAPVTFDSSSSMVIAGATYQWDSSDGTSSTLPTFTHSGFAVGQYNVKLTITENGVDSTSVKYITVLDATEYPNLAPQASFTILDGNGNDVTGTTLTTYMSYTFQVTTLNAQNHNWDFGDNNNSDNTNILPRQSTSTNGNAANNNLISIVHEFRGMPKNYTVTLASQSAPNLPTPIAGLDYFTGTTQQIIDVSTQGTRPPTPLTIAEIYEKDCANCHGIVVTGAFDNGKAQVKLGEYSFLPKKLMTKTKIQDAYLNEMLMSNIYQLTSGPAGPGVRDEMQEMADYINDMLADQPFPQTGEDLYITQCSRCHGTGTGAYAKRLMIEGMPGIPELDGKLYDELYLQDYIDGPKTVSVMSTIPYTLDTKDGNGNVTTIGTLTKISEFLNKAVPTPKPVTGNGLYRMYCSYCHGLDGTGGPFTHENIAGNDNIDAAKIDKEIKNGDNMMSRLQGKLDMPELKLIADMLMSLGAPPRADEDDD